MSERLNQIRTALLNIYSTYLYRLNVMEKSPLYTVDSFSGRTFPLELQAWIPSRKHIVSVNVDASVVPNITGVGSVIRGRAGNVLGWKCERFKQKPIYLAEAAAICRGLELAMTLGLKNAHVYSDNEAIANRFERIKEIGIEDEDENLKSYLKEAEKQMNKGMYCTFNHVYREQNRVADYLARLGRTVSEFQVPDSSNFAMPKELQDLVEYDNEDRFIGILDKNKTSEICTFSVAKLSSSRLNYLIDQISLALLTKKVKKIIMTVHAISGVKLSQCEVSVEFSTATER